MKRLLLALVMGLALMPLAGAATVTRGTSFSSSETVTNTKLHNLVDNATVTGIVSADITDGTVSTADIANATITGTDIAASTVAQSNLTGGLLMPSGAIFFMITGACPTGSTDVTATYSDSFVRINATGGSTGGADTHTHAAGSYTGPTHTHTGTTGNEIDLGGTGATTYPGGAGGSNHDHNFTTGADGNSAITGTSASTSNVPSYVTAVLCQVD